MENLRQMRKRHEKELEPLEKDIERMERKHQKEIRKLLNECKHATTEQRSFVWGLDPSGENPPCEQEVEMCKICEKIIKEI